MMYLLNKPHSTIKDIAQDVFSQNTPSTFRKVARRLDDLLERRLVGRFESSLFVGYRSPYTYHITRKGGAKLEQESISTKHVQRPTSSHFVHMQTKNEVERWVKSSHFRLASTQAESKVFLFKYMAYARSIENFTTQQEEERQEEESGYPSWKMIPTRIIYDDVFATEYDCIILIVTHPQSTGRIVGSRIEKYKSLLRYVKLLFVTQTELEYSNCHYFFEDRKQTEYRQYLPKVHIIMSSQIGDLRAFIQQSVSRYREYPSGRILTNDWLVKRGEVPYHPFLL